MLAPEAEQRVSFALDENRILMLGSQVLLGFGYEVFFEPGYDKVPNYNQDLQILNLAATLATAVALIIPTTYHRVVKADFDSARLLAITTASVEFALYPMTLSLGLSLFCCLATVLPVQNAILLSLIASLIALSFWSLGPHLCQHRKSSPKIMNYTTPLETRLRHVLTESRVMLPGAQALLGFQLITFFMDVFMKLPTDLKWIHVGSILLIAFAVVLLIAPAAFHRIADRGEATERSYSFASTMVLLAALPLGGGLAGEFAIVIAKATNNMDVALASGLGVLVTSYLLWYGIGFYARRRISGST